MALTAYARPIVVGLLILAAGLVPWLLLADINARVRPDVPWAALVTLVYIGGGDLAYTFFGVLRGDGSMLFAG